MSSNEITRIGTLTWQVEDGIGIVHLDRPDRMNALGATMKVDLDHVFFNLARNNASVHAVLITGQGERAFCAGADIKEKAEEAVTATDYIFTQRATHELFLRIEEFEKPTIAALNGVALGGGLELALCCDLRIAADHACLGLPEIKLGVIPGAGGTQRLPRLIGESRAKEMIYTAKLISAHEALQIGLVNEVASAVDLMPKAKALAQHIASMPPLAVRLAKRAIHSGIQTDMASGLEIERYAAGLLLQTEDRVEGMRAFNEKRKPQFKGR